MAQVNCVHLLCYSMHEAHSIILHARSGCCCDPNPTVISYIRKPQCRQNKWPNTYTNTCKRRRRFVSVALTIERTTHGKSHIHNNGGGIWKMVEIENLVSPKILIKSAAVAAAPLIVCLNVESLCFHAVLSLFMSHTHTRKQWQTNLNNSYLILRCVPTAETCFRYIIILCLFKSPLSGWGKRPDTQDTQINA